MPHMLSQVQLVRGKVTLTKRLIVRPDGQHCSAGGLCGCEGRCGNMILFCSCDPCAKQPPSFLLFGSTFQHLSVHLFGCWGPHRLTWQMYKEGMKLDLGRATSAINIYSNPQIFFEYPPPHVTCNIGKSCRMLPLQCPRVHIAISLSWCL